MTTYGRFGSFRASPTPQQRDGACKNGEDDALVQFAPVVIDGQDATDGRNTLALAAEGATPTTLSGVAIFEDPWDSRIGRDPGQTTSSDIDEIPSGAPCQRVQMHSNIKILVQNLSADDLNFDGMREYEGRTMFKPADLATLAIGDGVCPGAGGASGVWKKAPDAAHSWGYVREVDEEAGIVVFQLRSL